VYQSGLIYQDSTRKGKKQQQKKNNKYRWILALKTTKIRLKSEIPEGAQINNVSACTS